jgi:serine phosphatase RsbU (regulator of sigma subunit)
VNAGQNPPMIRRADGRYERLGSTGVALGMFEHSTFAAVETSLAPGEMLVMYSDGITEAEDPTGRPFEEAGLERVVERHAVEEPAEIGVQVIKAVEGHAKASRFIDDLTILLLKRRA